MKHFGLVGLSVLSSLSAVAQATPVATYSYSAAAFVENSAGTAIYAAIPSQNSVEIINPNTLAATLVGVGSNPTGLALSPDGSRLYVALNGSNFLGVMNTQTQAMLAPLSLGVGVKPLDVQVGNNNRLFVVTGAANTAGSLIQVNATTGASSGPNVCGTWGGRVRLSPDQNTLYYGNSGLTPSGEGQYDVSGTTPSTTRTWSYIGDGTDVALSKDGSLVMFPCAAQQPDVIQTSSGLSLGSIPGGQVAAFSPDNKFVYSAYTFENDSIRVHSLITYLQSATITTIGASNQLFVDNTGRYVFSSEVDNNVRVYDTGQVPEPTCLGFLATGMILALRRARGGNEEQ